MAKATRRRRFDAHCTGMRTQHPARYAAPMRASIAIASFCAATATLPGCDAPTAAPPARAASFDAHCAALPPSRFDVVAIPIRVAFDRTLSQRQLTAMYDRATAQHLTMGLTQARIGHRAAIEVDGVQEPGGARVCMRTTVRVELVMEPLTVFIARELEADPCRQAAVREHELRHVAVYEAALAAGPATLAAALESAFGGRTFGGPSVAVVEAQVETAVTRHLDAYLDATGKALRSRQAAVDTPEEYARVSAGCPPRRAP